MTKRPSFENFKKKVLQDPEVKALYELMKPESDVLIQFIKARLRVRWSQEELATKLAMQQPAIARLEGGGYATTTVKNLAKIADALGYKLKISLLPKRVPVRTAKTLQQTKKTRPTIRPALHNPSSTVDNPVRRSKSAGAKPVKKATAKKTTKKKPLK